MARRAEGAQTSDVALPVFFLSRLALSWAAVPSSCYYFFPPVREKEPPWHTPLWTPLRDLSWCALLGTCDNACMLVGAPASPGCNSSGPSSYGIRLHSDAAFSAALVPHGPPGTMRQSAPLVSALIVTSTWSWGTEKFPTKYCQQCQTVNSPVQAAVETMDAGGSPRS